MEYTENYKRKMVDLIVHRGQDIDALAKRYNVDAALIRQWCEENGVTPESTDETMETVYDTRGVKKITNKTGISYQARITVHIHGTHQKIGLGRYSERERAQEVFGKAYELRQRYKDEELLEQLESLKADYSQYMTTNGILLNLAPVKKPYRYRPNKGITVYESKKGGRQYYLSTPMNGGPLYFGRFHDLEKARCVSDKIQQLKERYDGDELGTLLLKLKSDVKNGTFVYEPTIQPSSVDATENAENMTVAVPISNDAPVDDTDLSIPDTNDEYTDVSEDNESFVVASDDAAVITGKHDAQPVTVVQGTDSLDERIKLAESAVKETKAWYEQALGELEKLMAQKKQLNEQRLLEAYRSSERKIDEIMAFLNSTT